MKTPRIFITLFFIFTLAACGGGGSGGDNGGGENPSSVEDTTPDTFNFVDLGGVAKGTITTSNIIIITGINSLAPISIAGGEYSINGNAYTALAGTIEKGSMVTVRLTSSLSFSTVTTATLTVGGVSDTLSVTTITSDSTPSVFSFADLTDVPRNQLTRSNAITINGINTDATFTISGGEYSIDGAKFSRATTGTVQNGSTIAVRAMSSSDYSTTVDVTVSFSGSKSGGGKLDGSIGDTFSITTIANPDSQAPTATIKFPPALSLTDGNSVTVTGTASDNGTITVVRVNGVDVTSSDGFANWRVNVPLKTGVNALIVETSDMALNSDANAAQVNITRKGVELSAANGMVLNNFIGRTGKTQFRALVVDTAIKSVVAVNMTTGARTIFSDNSTPNVVNPFVSPQRIVLDEANNRALVTDDGLNAVVAVDLTSGERTILSDIFSQNTLPFAGPSGIAVHSDRSNNRALVVNSNSATIFAVDLTTGTRSILSDSNTPNSVSFGRPTDIVVDLSNNQALVTDEDLEAVVAVDLTSGVRTILSDNSISSLYNFIYPIYFSNPGGIVLDSVHNRALYLNRGFSYRGTPRISAIDLTTGVRTILSDSSEFTDVDTSNVPYVKGVPDLLTPFRSAGGMTMDIANNQVLVTDNVFDAVIAVNLTSGVRSIVSNYNTPDKLNSFISPNDIKIDTANNRLLITDAILNSVIAVDLTNGARTIVSDDTVPNAINPFTNNPVSIDIDRNNNRNRALVIDSAESLSAIVAMDLSPLRLGSRTKLLTSGLRRPQKIVMDNNNNRALILDSVKISSKAEARVMAMDLDFGTLTILSDNSIPNADNPIKRSPVMMLDSANNQVLVAATSSFSRGRGLLAVDLTSGTRTILSDDLTPNADNPFSYLRAIELDSANNRALVIDAVGLKGVDLTSGARTILSDDLSPNNYNLFSDVRSAALDSANNLLWVVDADTVIVVELGSGERVIFSK